MAKNLILYFSGTGNSLAVAKQIAQELEDTELCAMAACPTPAGQFDRVGFVAPNYAGGLPLFVETYLKTLDVTKVHSDYFFFVETYGGVPGNTVSQVDKLLQGKGVTLSYGKSVRMFANYIALYPMKGNVEKKARKAGEKTARIAQDILAQTHNAPFRQSRFFAHYHIKLLPGMLRKVEQFNVSGACIGCGKCVRLCPDENIHMENGSPVIGANCEQCMACIQWCPAQAINYLDKTGGVKYHHPAVTVDELMVR